MDESALASVETPFLNTVRHQNAWFETLEGSQFRVDRVIAVIVNAQESNRYQCFAVLDGGKVVIDLSTAEANRLKRRIRDGSAFV